MDWRDRAACRKEDPDLWFPHGKGALTDYQYGQARAICLSCPVIRNCEAWARAVRPEFGMLAGLTPEQRRIRHGAPITAFHNPSPARLVSCANCPKQFEPLPDWPKGRLCADCRSVHNDPRSRDPLMRRRRAVVTQ